MPLFRQEVVTNQSERLTGRILLTQPLSIKLTVLVLVFIAVSIVIFFFNAQYSRKETVRGFLMPSKGVIKVFSNQTGTIEQLLVSEGQYVMKGQPLAVVTLHQQNGEGVDLSAQLKEQISAKLQLIEEEIEQHSQLQKQEVLSLNNQKEAFKNEKIALNKQLSLAEDKLALLSLQQHDFKSLNQDGYLSNLEIDRQKQALLEAMQEKQNISRLILQHQKELNQLDFKVSNIPQQYKLQTNLLKRLKADNYRQMAQVENNYKYTITAANNGVVTGIQVVIGEMLKQSKTLMHILPEGSELVAELLLPTRSAGFIKKGHQARLRFDAFPYQRFGFIESEIVRIDQALIVPNEVHLPINLQEPVYRLRATLNQQQVNAFGKHFNLKSGMLFEADIMLEQRTLIEWLFAPLYSLKGRIS